MGGERYWPHEWGGSILFSHGSTTSRGVCILINPSISYVIVKKEICHFGRFIIIDLKVQDRTFTLVCIYAPNIVCPLTFTKLSGIQLDN